ncbi:MAG TPA: hypothetical protein VGI22_12310, partial [Xanthobacteraceae bacterium]
RNTDSLVCSATETRAIDLFAPYGRACPRDGHQGGYARLAADAAADFSDKIRGPNKYLERDRSSN